MKVLQYEYLVVGVLYVLMLLYAYMSYAIGLYLNVEINRID